MLIWPLGQILFLTQGLRTVGPEAGVCGSADVPRGGRYFPGCTGSNHIFFGIVQHSQIPKPSALARHVLKAESESPSP